MSAILDQALALREVLWRSFANLGVLIVEGVSVVNTTNQARVHWEARYMWDPGSGEDMKPILLPRIVIEYAETMNAHFEYVQVFWEIPLESGEKRILRDDPFLPGRLGETIESTYELDELGIAANLDGEALEKIDGVAGLIGMAAEELREAAESADEILTAVLGQGVSAL